MRIAPRYCYLPGRLVSLGCAIVLFGLLTPGWADAPAKPAALSETPLSTSLWQDDYTHWLFIALSSSGPRAPGRIDTTAKGQRVIWREWHPLPVANAHPQSTPRIPRGEGKWEERQGKWYEKIGGLSTDITSTFVAYTAYREKAWYVAFGEQEWGPYAEKPQKIGFSPDGKRLVFVVHSANETIPFIDGQPGIKAHDVDKFLFSEDGKHLAYLISDDARTWRYVIDDKEQPAYPGVYGLVFSPDNHHYAYIAKNDAGKFGVVCDGKAMTFYDDIANGQQGTWSRYSTTDSPLVFSPDSASLAYVASMQDKSFVVQDGTPLREFTHTTAKPMNGQWISNLVFSANDHTLAYRVTDGTHDIIVTPDATWETPKGYKDTSLALSQDGKHIALVAGGPGPQSVYVDGKPGPYYQQILPIRDANNQPSGYIRFSANDTFHYFALKDKTAVDVLVVEEQLPRGI